MKYNNRSRESRECSDNEKINFKRKKSMIFQSPNWSYLQNRQRKEIESSSSQMNFSLLSAPATDGNSCSELTTTIGGFKGTDLMNMNIQTVMNERLQRMQLLSNWMMKMSIMNAWNMSIMKAWIRQRLIMKHRRLHRMYHRVRSSKSETAVEYTQTTRNNPEKYSHISEETCRQLNQLNINSETVKNDAELAMRMSTLSCTQDNYKNYEKSFDELVNGFGMIWPDSLMDQIDGKMSGLKIEEVPNGNSDGMIVNSFR